MGYYAYGNGSVLLKNGINKEELFKKLDEKLNDAFGLEYEFNKAGMIDITDYENYSAEDIMEFLNILIPYIKEGSIEYSGDDDYHWKFVFNEKDQKWDEFDGEVYYSLEDFSDNDLIEELNKRGYAIIYIENGEKEETNNIANDECRSVANILFNMSLGMDYDTFADDYKDDMEMLTESVGKLAKKDDPLYYVLQNVAGNNEEMGNKLVNADGSICR